MSLKRGFAWLYVALIITILLFSYFALAQQDESSKIKKAYIWLQGRAIGKWQNLNMPQHVFSLMALKTKLTQSQLDSSSRALLQKSYSNGTCWPGPTETSCNALDTALAKIGLFVLSQDQTKVNEWLLNHTITPSISGISWFLQLTQPSSQEVRCFLSYENQGIIEDHIVSFDNKGVLGGEWGSCFDNATYWLQLKEECTEKTFTVSCNDSILANFLMKKNNEWFVISKTESASPLGNLSIKLITKCIGYLGQTGLCNYEATLWTAYAFAVSGQNDIAKTFLPYLIMNAELSENQKFLPEAFLYKLTGQQSYASKLTLMQKQDGLWLAPGSSNKYYDTALVVLMTQGTVGNITKTKETLLREQKTDGSWDCSGCNNIRDTALIILGIWPDYEWRSPCEIEGYSCVANCTEAGGSLISSDCFTGECCNISFSCEQKYGQCKASCLANETQVDYSCSTGICCKEFSKSLCVAEIHGTVCGSGQECLSAQQTIIPFIYSSDSPYCCKGTCSSAGLTCQEANGSYCDPNAGYSCSQDKWIQATDTIYCCQTGYCTEMPQTCQDKGGEICSTDEDCKNGVLVNASNTQGQATCCIQGGICIPKTCQYDKCEEEESCVNGDSYETSDALICCEGQCVKSCSSQGGTACNATLSCKGSIRVASDTSRCCIGRCEKAKSFPITTLIIIIIVVIILALFYLFKTGKIKLKGKPKPAMPAMPIEYGFPPTMPPRGMPVGFPRTTSRLLPPKPLPQKPTPTKPIVRPVASTAKPAAQAQKTIQKPIVTTQQKPLTPVTKSAVKKKLPPAPKPNT